ncbi:MAG: hypothetical protein JW697_06800, partial [Kosmotogaceae bacterium]|nr:hypothetical protein [Kosmotogaceae bacterium]
MDVRLAKYISRSDAAGQEVMPGKASQEVMLRKASQEVRLAGARKRNHYKSLDARLAKTTPGRSTRFAGKQRIGFKERLREPRVDKSRLGSTGERKPKCGDRQV